MGRPKKTKGGENDDSTSGSDSLSTKTKKILPFADFLEFSKSYPDKTAICFYLYRLWPVIDLKLVNLRTTNIDKLTSPAEIALDALTRKWGRGKYRLCLTDSNKPGDKRVCETRFEINDSEHEPAFEHGYRELDIGCPENKSFVQGLRIKGMLPRGDEEVNDSTGTAAAMGTMAATIQQLATAKPAAPEAKSTDIKDIIEAAKLFKTEDKTAQDVLAEMRKQNDKLMDMVLNSKAAAQPDPLAELKRFEKIAEIMSGRSAETSWLSELAKLLAPLVPLLVVKLAGGSSAPAPPPARNPQTGPYMPAPELPSQENDPMYQMMQTAQKALRAFDKGMSGDSFAEALCTMDDQEALYEAIAQMGEDGILAALRSVPQWALLAPREPQVLEFVRAFLSYGAPPDDIDAPPAAPEVQG